MSWNTWRNTSGYIPDDDGPCDDEIERQRVQGKSDAQIKKDWSSRVQAIHDYGAPKHQGGSIFKDDQGRDWPKEARHHMIQGTHPLALPAPEQQDGSLATFIAGWLGLKSRK